MPRVLESVAQRRFTVEEYHRMAEAGILRPDERIELVRGVIRKKNPKSRAHVIATKSIHDLLDVALRRRGSVYCGAPIVVEGIDSEPEPDLLVCSNPDELAYGTSRTMPLLVVEVADSSLEFDLGVKPALYADVGVPEYWVVNLVGRALVIFRKPLNGAYRESFSLDETARVTPEAWPDMSFDVFAFLPPAKPRLDDAP
jgi:Uma2 family endonuclease